MNYQLETPILFLIFNRPEVTRKVFSRIREVKPSFLYVAADGPRPDHIKDVALCAETRSIIDQVDWNCEVFKLYRDQNYGLRKGVGQAITWFFENVEQGIVLEDDCFPEVSFFSFCQKLLDKYHQDPKIMHIGGNNFQNGVIRGSGTYYFSRISHIWGWATWARAWEMMDQDMDNFDEFKKEKKIERIFPDKYSQSRWLKMLNKSSKPISKSWAFPWSFSIFDNDGYCITPNYNLVSNLGFGLNSTHSIDKNDKLSKLETTNIESIVHPAKIQIDKAADVFTNKTVFKRRSLTELARIVIARVFRWVQE